ncbi:hypothetical protein G647_02930 [Cladophialophora carrionii CBS 160.54]|uniref:Heterokaryon incompatibility domain-containing protein n=1 Tax=Cladophialophora carrionii CBS 160.54 TaxID=1279043 RepID=V9DIK3_9EURO|nr:uncharacterized protein G647_02930 [Cladophialophora carrionii CBS 160.54]ETI26153.1 hypothetical protein G647_02930 [Cladophialophora carrionii CBS 160.54]
MPPILYQPLDDEEIRLLTIHSQNNFSLQTACLKQNLRYDAVSYCWGKAHDLCNVRVNGYEIPLRRHVATMLDSLYRHRRITHVWLDMLCINQSDEDDKSKQVLMMGEIFKRAEKVYAWLGEADREMDCIFDVLLDFRDRKADKVLYTRLDAAERLSEYREMFREIYQERVGSLPEPRESDDERLHEEFNWLRPLYARPFWGRLWIVQELILAKEVIVCYGTKCIALNDIYGLSLDWGSFEQGFDACQPDYTAAMKIAVKMPPLVPEQEETGMVETEEWDDTTTTLQHPEAPSMDASEKSKSHSRGWKTIQAIRGHRRRRESLRYEPAADPPHPMVVEMSEQGDVAEIDEVVEVYARHQCCDPKDKVYGLRELVKEWREKLKPEYKKSVLEVFLDVARLDLFKQEKNGGLHVAFGLWSEMGLGGREKFNDCLRQHFPEIYSRHVSRL